jgi:hypothetical protein
MNMLGGILACAPIFRYFFVMPGLLNNPPIIRVRLKYPDVMAFTYHYAHRLTSKGLFLVVKTPSLPGMQVRFELLLENSEVVFAGIGEITWIKPFPDPKGFYGMIIRFITLDEGCQQILQMALSQKDAVRKEAFDHQKISEDLSDDQIETMPFISPPNLWNHVPAQDDSATSRYYSLQAKQLAEESPTGFGARIDLEATRISPERERGEASRALLDDDELEEDPTEDSSNQSTKRAISLRFAAAIPEQAPTSRTPSLALIEGLAAQQMQPRQIDPLPSVDDPSDVTTGDNLSSPKIPWSFGKLLVSEDDAPTDSSTKENFFPVVEAPKLEAPEADSASEDVSLEFISKRHIQPESHRAQARSADSAQPNNEGEELDATAPLSKEPSATPPREESSSWEDLALATTGEQNVLPLPREQVDENLEEEEMKSSKTQTKRTRRITQSDLPTNIRMMMSKPVPTNVSEQDAEMKRLAHEAGLADLDVLVGWSKELIRNMPRTPAQIEQELMALAIASKKLY